MGIHELGGRAVVYAASREGNLIHSLLKDFTGVLVSDFYAAYNSINCPQQKCLIHLIRDLNDDLLKEPFNEEMKGLVAEFAILLQAIISTVDRFGLKARFLRAHKRSVHRFFKRFAQREYQTETALKCKTRLEKNRCGLFTFLDFDAIPWNNNNAEHAIKALALLRRHFDGVATEKGIREYLILLSICESCKFKGVSFLEFLRSGETDIDVFAACKQRRGKKRSTGTQGASIREITNSRFDPKTVARMIAEQCEMALFDDTVDLQRKMCLEVLALRIGETDVGKHVATAFFEGHSVLSFSCHNQLLLWR